VALFSKLPQHFPERNEQIWGEKICQANGLPEQFNNLFTVYLPIMFKLTTTQHNMLGWFEKKRIGRDVEGDGHYLILDTTPALICKEWRKTIKDICQGSIFLGRISNPDPHTYIN